MLDSKPDSMDLNHISDADRALVGQVLRAAADVPFFADWEFHTLFGLTRSEFRAVGDAWPNVELNCADVSLADCSVAFASRPLRVTSTDRNRAVHPLDKLLLLPTFPVTAEDAILNS